MLTIINPEGTIIGYVRPSFINVWQEHSAPFKVGAFKEYEPTYGTSESMDEPLSADSLMFTATFKWHYVPLYEGRYHIDTKWYLMALDMPEEAWQDPNFVRMPTWT